MSCYNWEKGYVKLPVKQWKKTRDSIINDYNYQLSQAYKTALSIYEMVKAEKKGKRKFDVYDCAFNLTYKAFNQGRHDGGQWYFSDLVVRSMIKDKKLIKPKKKDFAPVKNTIQALYDSDLRILFDNKTKTIEYCVNDNNHAVESAHSSPLGQAFFSAMERVEFTSKTGGFLRYYDEYMSSEGKGASISKVWGKYKNKKYLKHLCNC